VFADSSRAEPEQLVFDQQEALFSLTCVLMLRVNGAGDTFSLTKYSKG
jgi:hypothetical protein